MRLRPARERCFPLLALEGYHVTSNETYDYNCIAFAADDESRWWWPDAAGHAYWPEGVDRNETLGAFISAYRTLGYERCDTEELEDGFEKIVLYIDVNGIPTHASKQLADGRWKSKLGRWEDIEHDTVTGVCGNLPAYGSVAVFLKRMQDRN